MNYGDDNNVDDQQKGASEDRFALFLAIIAIAVTILFVVLGALRLAALKKDERPKTERQLESLLRPWLGPRPAGMSLIRYCQQLEAASMTASHSAIGLASAIYASRFGTLSTGQNFKLEMNRLKRELKPIAKPKRSKG